MIINKHNDYQRIINDNVLPYCQFIDNNLYTNLDRCDRLIDNQLAQTNLSNLELIVNNLRNIIN